MTEANKPRRSRAGWFVFLVLSAVVVTLGVLAVMGQGPRRERLSDASLVDQRGEEHRPSELRGRLWIATFVGAEPTATTLPVWELLTDLRGRLPESVGLWSFAVGDGGATGAGSVGWPVFEGSAALGELAKGVELTGEEVGQLARSPGLIVALIDRTGRLSERLPWTTSAAEARAELDRLATQVEFLISLETRPRFHAVMNGSAAVLLVVGLVAILRRQVKLHLSLMLAAGAASAVFLGSYLYYHAHAGSTPFLGQGIARTVYFTVLLSHTALAAFLPPLIGTVLYHAARNEFPSHRRLARWTLPIWLYVSVTGVVIYLMLY